MFDKPHELLFLFGSLLGLGNVVIFTVLYYVRSSFGVTETANLKKASLLRDRMHQVGIPTWTALQAKSSLGRTSLRHVRSGKIAELKLGQLTKLASALNWTLEELLAAFHFVSVPAGLKEDQQTPTELMVKPSHSANSDKLEALRQECLRLRNQLQQQGAELTNDLRDATFQQLQTLLTNYPSVRQMVQAKPDLPARNVFSLFTSLDNLLESWGYKPIGSVWEQVPYKPQLHQPDTAGIEEGEPVYIRFVGYQNGERILCPAKVSRTLPGGVK